MGITLAPMLQDPILFTQLICLLLTLGYILKLILGVNGSNYGHSFSPSHCSLTERKHSEDTPPSGFDVGRLISLPKDYLRHQNVA